MNILWKILWKSRRDWIKKSPNKQNFNEEKLINREKIMEVERTQKKKARPDGEWKMT